MTAVLVGMVLVVLVALAVISAFSEDDDRTRDRAGHSDPDEAHLDDLLS